MYMTTTGPNYKIRYDFLSDPIPNNTPSLSGWGAPATVYAYQSFFINITATDADGVRDLFNVTIGFQEGGANSNYTWTDPLTWTTTTANSRVLFDTGSCTNSSNATSNILSFAFKIYWNGTDGATTVWAKVFDDSGANTTSTSIGLFTFESDLIVQSASSNDTRCNISQDLNITGWIFYEGTSIAPYDDVGLTVYTELSGVNKGSDTSLSANGNFSMVFSAPAIASSNGYNVYTSTDEYSVTNQTVTVISDDDLMGSFTYSGFTRPTFSVNVTSAYDGIINSRNVNISIYMDDVFFESHNVTTSATSLFTSLTIFFAADRR